jgi:hypothetical protein
MKRKTKLNLELLNEEQKRFRLLSEYDFYQESKTEPEYEKPLLLGDLEEADDNPSDEASTEEPNTQNTDDAVNDIESELGVDDAENTPDEPVGDLSEPEADDMGTEEPVDSEIDDMGTEEPIDEPASDEVEVDVTSLVQGSEEAKQAADRASQNSEELLQKLADLENRIARMDAVSSKIEDLEKEIIKRNPTPVEKLEMRSLNSFPYTQKLTDYWSDKTGQYDVMNNEKKKEEYVLTNNDVDYGYSEPQVRQSFDVNPEDYEEEEI